MHYLSSADIIALHELLLTEFGGMRGITEAGYGRLEAAVAAPQMSAFGEELYPDAPAKAAALCLAIVRAHPFSDGNKRVALVALDAFLSHNGGKLTADNDTAYATMMALAQGIMTYDQLVTWVRAHLEMAGHC